MRFEKLDIPDEQFARIVVKGGHTTFTSCGLEGGGEEILPHLHLCSPLFCIFTGIVCRFLQLV